MAYLFLFAAIFSEVVGTTATRLSDGFTKPYPTAIAVVGVVGAYYFLSLSLAHGMALGVAYGIWSALGILAIAAIGAVFIGDKLNLVQMVGVVLIVAGVLSLEFGADQR